MAIKFPNSEGKKFTKNLVKRHKLVPHLENYLSKEIVDFEFKYEPKVPDDAWHPSGHCTPSVTDLYAIATGNTTPKEWGASMLKTFMVGHFWHQLLQKAVVDIGFAQPEAIERRGHRWWGTPIPPADVEHWPDNEHGGDFHKRMYRKEDLFWEKYPEQKDGRITDDMLRAWPTDEHGMAIIRPMPYHWATGAGDVAPCVIPKQGSYVVDYKTMSGHQYKSETLPEWAAVKYECQINIYMDFFDEEKGLIVAVQKDSPHDMKEFEFVRNQDLIDAIYAKWEFVSECIANGDPPNDFDNDNFEIEQFAKGPIAQ